MQTPTEPMDTSKQFCPNEACSAKGTLDLVHVQADEIRVKGCRMIAWMGLAMMVSTCLWLGGVVQLSRDRRLADRMLQQVRRCAQELRPLLVLTDSSSAYPNSIHRAFREKVITTNQRKILFSSLAFLRSSTRLPPSSQNLLIMCDEFGITCVS